MDGEGEPYWIWQLRSKAWRRGVQQNVHGTRIYEGRRWVTPEMAETESLDRWAHMRLEGTKVKRLPDDLNPSDLRVMWVRTPPRAPQLSWLYISGTRRVVPDRLPRVTSV